MGRPVIGISATLTVAQHGVWSEPVSLVSNSLLAAVQRAGGLSVLFSLDETTEPDELLSLVDAVVLHTWLGEDADLAPASSAPEYEKVQRLELALATRAAGEGTPVLGLSPEVANNDPLSDAAEESIKRLLHRAVSSRA